MLRSVYRQIIPASRAAEYLSNRVWAGFVPWNVAGFATFLNDSAQVSDPGELWDLIRPDHPGTDMARPERPAQGLWALDFQLDDDSETTLVSTTLTEDAPFDDARFLSPWNGSGRAASTSGMAREFVMMSPLPMLPGAALVHIGAGGAQRAARLDADLRGRLRWVREPDSDVFPLVHADEQGATPEALQGVTALHRMFIEADGWLPATALGNDVVLVTSADQRAVRQRMPWALRVGDLPEEGAADGQQWAPPAGWALASSRAASRTWATTTGMWGGVPVTVTTARATETGVLMAGICHVGRPFVGMESVGFHGNQYCGFYAEVPWESVESVSTVALEAGPLPHSKAPKVRAPHVAPKRVDWHEDYVLFDASWDDVEAIDGPEDPTAGVPTSGVVAGAVTPVLWDSEGHAWAQVPDFRAADIMFDHHGPTISAPGYGVLVDLAGHGLEASVKSFGTYQGATVPVVASLGDELGFVADSDEDAANALDPRFVPAESLGEISDVIVFGQDAPWVG